MKNSELIERLARRQPQLKAADTECAVRMIQNAISQALQEGNRVEIRGFGRFVLNHRRPKEGRNPRTGETVNVPAKYAPNFRPGKELRERVDAAHLSLFVIVR